MNSQGYTKDNIHKGSTKIVAGDLNVDGNLNVDGIQVNSLSIDGYTLPTSAGTDGQVITMNADNTTTSFKDIPSSTERIATSRWFTQQQSLLNFSAYTGIFLNSNTGNSTTIGDSIIPATDLILSEENYSVLHVQFILRINTTDIAQPNQWQCRLRLDDGVGQGTIEWEVQEFTGTLQTNSERIQDFYLTFIRNPADPSKINVSSQSIKHTNAISSTAPTSTNLDKLFLSNNQFKLGSETGEISMLLPTTKSYFCQFNNYADGRPLTITMACQRPNPNVANTIDYGVLMGELYTFKKQTLAGGSGGGGGTSDHLLLSNLDGGALLDGGHTNMFVISGAKPMIGNMDMNNNDILNVSDLRGIGSNNHINMNPSNQMDISSGIIQLISTSSIQYRTTSFHIFRINNIDKMLINASQIAVKNAFLNMDNNDITNAAVISGPNGDLDFTGTETHLNSNNDLHLEAASNFNTEVRIQGTGEFKVLHGGSDRFSVGNFGITANRAISMDNNDIDDIRNLANVSQGISINFGTLVPNQLQIISGDTIIRDISSGNAIKIDSNRIIIDGLIGNTEIKAIGADVELTCNNLNLQGASSINNDKIAMNNTLTEHPIIVYLPALLADFPDPVKNLLVKINTSGNIQPIAYGDPDSTGVVGSTHEIVVADGLVPVQVGGICSFTPAPTVVILPGAQLEKTNTGVPTIFGCVQPSNGVGTCAVALTGGTGAIDGSVKILGLWQKNEHF